MDIKPILDNYEAQQQAAENARKEQMNKERLARLANAEVAEARIQSVVEPVFLECQQQLKANGYPCDIVWEKKADPVYGSIDRKQVGIGLKLAAEKQKGVHRPMDNWIKYYGGFEGQGIGVETRIGSTSNPVPGAVLPAESVTRERVEQDLQDFLKKIFIVQS